MSWLFPAKSHSLGGFLVPELVIPGRKNHSSSEFLVYELVIPGRITIYPVECWQSADEILPLEYSSMSW
jgi:hypothetical protein